MADPETPEVTTPEDAQPTDAAEKKAAKDFGDKTVPAADRTLNPEKEVTRGGLMDNMSTRSDADAFEGHFVTIDPKAAEKAYKDVQGLDGHTGYYGVYIQPVELDDNGIPVLAQVRLRDETNSLVTVPYEALTPADAKGR